MDIPKVKAERLIKKIKGTSTEPCLVRCSDGNSYYVKFAQNPEGPRVLVNEFVAGSLAILLDLPVPKFEFIDVQQDFINVFSPDLPFPVTAGIHFGSQEVKKALAITNGKMLDELSNSEIVPMLLLFDHWIHNADRDKNKGNLLLNLSTKELIVIDHTHVFEIGPLWDAVQLQHRIAETSIAPLDLEGFVYHRLIRFVKGNDPFAPALDRFNSLVKESVVSIVGEIPEEWGCTEQEKHILLEYLMNRHSLIPSVPQLLRSQLPYWKGGV